MLKQNSIYKPVLSDYIVGEFMENKISYKSILASKQLGEFFADEEE